jgi:Mg2+ and Co2+ transporter CorA
MLDNKKELYDKMVKDYKKEINDIGSDTDKVENDLKTMLKDAVLDGSSEQTSQVVKVYKQSLDLYDSTVEAYKNTKSKIKGLYKALKDNTTVESQEALIKSKSKNKDINMLIDDSTIRIC